MFYLPCGLVFFFFNWRIITLQNFVFCQTSTWISHRLIQHPCLCFLSHRANSCWLSILQMVMFNSVQFSRSVGSDFLWPHGLQHARLTCPSPTPRIYSNSCPSSQWCHRAISSFVVPFSSHLLSFPASGSFQMSQFFVSGGQSIGVSASASVLPMNIQDWFPLGWTGWISLQGTLKSLLQNHSSETSSLWCSAFFIVQLSHPTYDYWKNHSLDQMDLCWLSNVSAF